jgi:oligopeptide/dipeptide ABC transporter ATP-binding protein
MAVLLITHDLGVVAGSTDRIGVMYAGRIVESGPTDQLLREPSHPYTVGLMRAVPRLDRGRDDALLPIAGLPPDLRADLPGCPFAPRCPWRVEPCWTEPPPIRPAEGRPAPAAGPSHLVACHNPPTAIEAARGAPERPGFSPAPPPT